MINFPKKIDLTSLGIKFPIGLYETNLLCECEKGYRWHIPEHCDEWGYTVPGGIQRLCPDCQIRLQKKDDTLCKTPKHSV